MEESEEKSEESTPTKVECPNCGELVERFELRGPNAKVPTCPACGKWVSKDKIPNESIVRVQLDKPPKDIELKEPEDAGTGILKRAREPHEVLEQILEENDIGDAATARLVRKCKRMPGGMHPDYLQGLLTKIKGGVGKRADAELIADDYRWALEKEEEKAQKLEGQKVYPTSRRGARSSPTPQARGYDNDSSVGQRVQKTLNRKLDRRQGSKGDGNLTREDVQEMIGDVVNQIQRKQEREQLEERVRKTRQQTQQFQQEMTSQVKDMMRNVTDKMEDIAEMANKPPEGVVTKDELKKIKLNNQLKFYKQQTDKQEELMKDLSDRNIELQNKLEEFQNKMSERIEGIRRKAERSSRTGEGYQSDEFRLMGEGFNRVATALEQKNIGREVRKAVESLAGPQPTAEKPPKSRTETEGSKSNVPALLEETGAENLVEGE